MIILNFMTQIEAKESLEKTKKLLREVTDIVLLPKDLRERAKLRGREIDDIVSLMKQLEGKSKN